MKYMIVVNTINRSVDLVERCLESCLSQKIKPISVVLIDQNENLLRLKNEIAENPIFIHTKTKAKAVSAARNSLIVPSGAEWIFFCDDDGYPSPGYSEELQKIIMENPSIEMLAGKIVREDTNTAYTIRQNKFNSLKKFRYTKNLMGSNFAVKAEVFNKLGRFDENFGAGSYWGSSEETDLCWKAFFSGVDMEYFPQLVVYHVPPFHESVRKGFLKAFKYGIGKGALVYKWLFKKKKIIVTFELLEMLIVPFIQMLRGIFVFKFQLIPNSLATISGRVYGLLKAFFAGRF